MVSKWESQMTKQQELHLCHLYRLGWKAVAIEEYFRVTRWSRKAILKKHNVELRQSGPQRTGCCMVSEDRQLELCKLFQEGMPNKDIETQFNISSCTRRVILKRHGIRSRKEGRQPTYGADGNGGPVSTPVGMAEAT